MAENTPFYMDINNVYSGDELGLPYRDLMSEGIVGATDLAVSAGTGNTVNVAGGAGWVTGDTDINRQPTYRIYNDAVVNKGITPDPTNPRYVRVVAQINDATFSGGTRNWQIVAIHGTPAGSPAIPALPASALALATILVPAAAASSAAYTITDNRVRALVGQGQAQLGGYTLIQQQVLGASAGSVNFASIPQTFKHLELVWSGRTDQNVTSAQIFIRFNGDSSTNYDYQITPSTGSSITTGEAFAQTQAQVGFEVGFASSAGHWGRGRILIPDYTAGTNERMFLSENFAKWANTSGGMMRVSVGGSWRNNAAITSILMIPNGGFNFVSASIFTLYGIS